MRIFTQKEEFICFLYIRAVGSKKFRDRRSVRLKVLIKLDTMTKCLLQRYENIDILTYEYLF